MNKKYNFIPRFFAGGFPDRPFPAAKPARLHQEFRSGFSDSKQRLLDFDAGFEVFLPV
jgi:hypothetical protein